MIDYKKKLILTIAVVGALVSVIGLTYSFFSIRVAGNESTSTNLVTSASRLIKYTDLTLISNQSIEPGWTDNKTIVVENSGSKDLSYNLVWQSVTNGLTRQQDLVISITCSSNITSNICNGVTNVQVPATGINIPILSNISLQLNEKHTYVVTIKYLTQEEDQSIDMNKVISAKLGAKDI